MATIKNTLIGGAVGRLKSASMSVCTIENGVGERIIGLVDLATVQPKFSLNAQYSSVSDVLGAIPLVKDVAGENSIIGKLAYATTGAGVFNTGIFTRQYYTGNGAKNYLALDFNMKLVDNDGSGNHMRNAARLASWMSPKSLTDIYDTKDAKAAVASAVNELTELKNMIMSGNIDESLKATYNKIKSDIEAVGVEKYFEQKFSELTDHMDVINRIYTLAIGDWFSIPEMVIKSVSITPSIQHGLNGPLYFDVSISVESAMVLSDTKMSELFLNSLNGDGTSTIKSKRIRWSSDGLDGQSSILRNSNTFEL